MIDGLRTALIQHLAGSTSREHDGNHGEMRVAAATVVDRHLAKLHPARLAEIARKFAVEYAPRRAALEDEMRLADGTIFWPLLPRDFLAVGGARRVTSLATRDDLRNEGTLQDLCIKGGAEFRRMVDACASGRAHLLSLRDATSDARLSTAEIYLRRPMRGGTLERCVRQHKAKGNASPSAACISTLREVLVWAAGREFQDHLAQGQRMAWKRQRVTPAAVAERDCAATRDALQIALGDVLCATLESATREFAISCGVLIL